MEDNKKKWWQKEWDPIGNLMGKAKKAASTPTAPPPAKQAEKAPEGMPELKDLEKSGMMGKFYRYWKNPVFMKQMKAVAARMQAEGVNVKDQKAVQAWIEKNKDAIMSGKLPDAPDAPKQETVKNDGPQIGRNDPCSCGSGKKYKKCCG